MTRIFALLVLFVAVIAYFTGIIDAMDHGTNIALLQDIDGQIAAIAFGVIAFCAAFYLIMQVTTERERPALERKYGHPLRRQVF